MKRSISARSVGAPPRRVGRIVFVAFTTFLLALAMVLVWTAAWAQQPTRPRAPAAPAPQTTPPPASPASSAPPAGAPAASPNAPAPSAPAPSAPAPSAPAPSAPAPEVAGPTIRIPQTEGEKAEGYTIVAIEVSGNRKTTKEEVQSYLREKIGQAFKMETLTGDVRALWDAGFFDDVEVDMTRGDRGVTLRFLVRERPNVKAIEFSGNEEIENDKLSEAIEVKPNTILSIPAINRSVQKIKDQYQEKGYFLAEVSYTIDSQRDNEVIVKFKIVEHQQVTVRRVSFIGNDHIPESELRETMMTGQGSLLSFGSGGPYRQDMFERDVLMMSSLYYDRGYMNVQIGTPRVMLTPDREGIEITLVIHEGPRFKIRQLKVFERDENGNEIEPLGGRRALRQMIRAHNGDWFNRSEVVKDLQAVRTLYKDAGYYSVEADPEPEIDSVRREVDIVIPIKRGPLTRIERIEIKGNTKTRDKVIRREMEIEEGALYSETKVETSRKRINALGYFERVDVTPEIGSAPDRVTLYFEIAERATGTFQVGAGFSSVENFIATAQIQQANLFGNGQSLALQAQVSSLRQIISVRFFEPYFLNSDWSMSTEVFQQLYVYSDFSRSSLGASVTYGYALVQPWLRLSLTGTVQQDKVSTSNTTTFFGSTSSVVNTFPRLPLANLFNDGRTISLRPALVYDTRDNRLFPTSGIYLNLSTEWATEGIGSEIEYLRHRFSGNFYYPLGGSTGQPGSGFVLKLRTELGYITSPSSAGVPIYQRFFLGGILDMRGYRLRTIGTRLPLNAALDPNSAPINNGANIGGNLQAYSNLELEFPIIDKVGIRGVVFYDMGNAWNTEDQFCRTTPSPQFSDVVSPCFDASSLIKLRTSTGFGVRWFSPLGPLRFEWGFPLQRLPYEENYVFEFTIGNFF
ncbi:outer membrane protein assembly factor BamA [Pendulispora albinea]|uniref:Outer membrane protein assembly factor BamA n=1 Tax=Pendulispora albinea TaxID=2741071 RepID=A0ABZ2M9C9_9BACT